MPNSLTATGLTTATEAELVAYFTSAFQSIYGSDINLESDTPDGQLLNIFVQSVLDLQDLVVQVYNSFDPDNAIGVVLDQRVAINGIERQGGTYTTTLVTIVTSQSVNLYGLDQDIQDVFTVADNAGNEWQLITTQLGVSSGSHALLFRAANSGQVLTVPNTITIPITIILGVTSVNNPTTYSTLGVNEESDADLKIRRRRSVSLRSQGYFQGLLAALLNINGVTSAFIYENTTDGADLDGIPGHSIWVIVAGTVNTALGVQWSSTATYAYGDIASDSGVNYISVQNDNLNNLVSDTAFWQVYNPIAEAIYNYRNAGCGMFQSGESSANSYIITQVDGTFFPVYWDSVIVQTVFIKFNASSLNGVNPPNISAIISYLTENFVPGVFEEININRLSTLVQQADPNTLVTNSGFCLTDGGVYTNTLSPSTKNRQFLITSDRIIVLPIILTCPNGIQVIVSGVVTTTNVTVANLGTIQFTPLGGFPAFSYAVTSGAGSVTSPGGLFTAAGTGTSVVQITDALGNTATATITVTS
jgi:hypothetical protein